MYLYAMFAEHHILWMMWCQEIEDNIYNASSCSWIGDEVPWESFKITADIRIDGRKRYLQIISIFQ
jgi:hypothetical protein